MLFKGTAVTRGSGEGVVVATGMATELGQISSLVETPESETTPLEKRLDRLARRLIGLTLVIAALVAVTVVISGRGLYFAVEIAVALAVAVVVPPGMLSVIWKVSLSSTLAPGARSPIVQVSGSAAEPPWGSSSRES